MRNTPNMSPIPATASLAMISITIAVLAVLAATVGSLETIETAGAIGAKNHSVLLQTKASDAWAFYQAKSMKLNLYAALAPIRAAPRRQEYAAKAQRYEQEQKDIERDAKIPGAQVRGGVGRQRNT